MNRLFSLLTIITGGLLIWSLYLIFMYVPNERMMGPVQRILYFHAGSASACYLAVGVLFFASLGFLVSKKQIFDRLGQSSAEVALMFAMITFCTGMIWGQAAWNTPFRFEPRLVSTLILLLLLAGGISLRVFAPEDKKAIFGAGIGFLSAIMVPVVIYSIELLPHTIQVHPQVVAQGGLKDPKFTECFVASIITLSVFCLNMIWLGYKVRLIEDTSHGSRT